MPDAWRYVDGFRPEHLYDAHVLHPVLGPEDALGQPFGKRRVHDQLGWGLLFDGDVRGPPRNSLALWAKALVASAVPTATVASVLMSIVIGFSLGLSALRVAKPRLRVLPTHRGRRERLGRGLFIGLGSACGASWRFIVGAGPTKMLNSTEDAHLNA